MKLFVLWLYRHSGYGLALLRIIFGTLFFYSGYRKIFHLDFAVNFFANKGYPLPELIGPVLSILEFGGGFLLIIGMFSRYLGLLFTLEFLFQAAFLAMDKGFITARFEFILLTGAIMIATQGAGRFAVDKPGRAWEPNLERRRG